MRGIFILLTMSFLCFAVLPVSAQDGPAPYIQNEVFQSLPYNIQEEILEEAEGVYNDCSGRVIYAKYTDCACLALEFINARVEDPERHSSILVHKVTNKCPNIEGMAGFAYNSCLQVANRGDQNEAYCTCVANDVAKRYGDKPVANMDFYQRNMSDAMVKCSLDLRRQNQKFQ